MVSVNPIFSFCQVQFYINDIYIFYFNNRSHKTIAVLLAGSLQAGTQGDTIRGMSYPLRVPIEVRFSDLDTLKHVNNAVYLTYDEVARGHYLRRVGAAIDGGNFVMARAEVDYIRPILFGQQVEAALRVEAVGNKSFRTHSEIWADGALAARIKVVVVWLEEGRPARVPDWLRQAIQAFETEPVEGL